MKKTLMTTAERTPLLTPRRLIPLAVLLAGFVAFFAAGLDEYLSVEALHDNRDALVAFAAHYGVLAKFVYMLVYAVVVAFSLPGGALMTIIGGFLFGTATATVVVVIGATIGACALFLIAKTTVGDALRARAGPGLRKMEAGFQKNAFSYLLFLRLVPAFPFFLVNLAPAFLGVRLSTYFMATLIGIIPGTFVYASVGNGLSAVLAEGGRPDLYRIFEPDVLIPIIALAVLVLLPVIYQRLRGNKAAPSSAGAP